MEPDASNLKRPIYPMQDDLRTALRDATSRVLTMPVRPFSRTTTSAGSNGPEGPETQQKRFDQMLRELATGDANMNMR